VSDDLSPPGVRTVLERACAVVGLDPDGARLLRTGSNAVYRLTGPVIVRVSRQGADAAAARRAIAVARWLQSADYPSVRALGFDQPVVVDGHVVTFWEPVSDDGDRYSTVAEVAQVLAQLHALVPPDDLELPVLSPFECAADRISASQWLRAADRDFLTAQLARLQHDYADLRFALEPGVIHGDASIGNVLRGSQGKPALIDLDGFATGPREWDLALTAVYFDSFGWHTSQEYQAFARVYGFDIMRWPGYPVMREVREFLMVTWIIQQAAENKAAAAEASKRIAALRTGASRKDWQPF
jgi:aminoglycoside phosphotransferase (APT) family kinase protein